MNSLSIFTTARGCAGRSDANGRGCRGLDLRHARGSAAMVQQSGQSRHGDVLDSLGAHAVPDIVVIYMCAVGQWAVFNAPLYLFLSIMALTCHVKTMLTNPGAVPRHAQPLIRASESGIPETATPTNRPGGRWRRLQTTPVAPLPNMQPLHRAHGSSLPLDEQLRRREQPEALHALPLLHDRRVRAHVLADAPPAPPLICKACDISGPSPSNSAASGMACALMPRAWRSRRCSSSAP